MMQAGRSLSIPFMPSVLFSIGQARFILRRAWRRDVVVRSISRRKIKCTCYSCADARTVLTGCARPASLLRRILKLDCAYCVCKTSSSTQTSTIASHWLLFPLPLFFLILLRIFWAQRLVLNHRKRIYFCSEYRIEIEPSYRDGW